MEEEDIGLCPCCGQPQEIPAGTSDTQTVVCMWCDGEEPVWFFRMLKRRSDEIDAMVVQLTKERE